MSKEISNETSIVPEKPWKADRVVVYGSNTSGVQTITIVLETYLERMGKNYTVEAVRDAGLINQAFYNIDEERNIKSPQNQRTVPKGVVVLPEMRQYYDGKGMFLGTYTTSDGQGGTIFTLIRGLCKQNNVPLVNFRRTPRIKTLEKKLFSFAFSI